MMSHNLFDDHKLWGKQTRALVLLVLLKYVQLKGYLSQNIFILSQPPKQPCHIHVPILTDNWHWNKNVCHPFLENIVKPKSQKMQFAHFSASFFQFSTLRKWSQGQKNFCIKMVWRQDKAAALKMGILIKYYPISMFALVLRENKSHKNQHLKKFNSIQPKTFKTTQFLRSQLLGSLKLFPECLFFV